MHGTWKAASGFTFWDPEPSGAGRIMKCTVLLLDKALGKNVASVCINLTRKLVRAWQLGEKKKAEGKIFLRGGLWQANDECSLVQKEHWKCLHINCLLRFPFFKTNECFRFKHNCSLLITVLVTLLFFPLISTCESRTENDEPTSWGQWPSASADLGFAGDPEACCGGYRSRNIILYIWKITIIKFH